MICGRCDQPILKGQPFEKLEVEAPSRGGDTVYFHKPLCTKAPFQTTPQIPHH